MIIPASLALALASGAYAQTPVFTQLPASTSFQCIGLYISNDGSTVSGFIGGDTSFIWRRDGIPQMEVVSGPQLRGSVSGMSNDGTRFLFGYVDPSVSVGTNYPNGLINCALYENNAFSVKAPPAIAEGCDESINSPTAMSGDGQTLLGMPWNTCRGAPFAWRADTGWTAWATQPEFPPFGTSGYQSHRATAISHDGTRGCGWFQSGTGYGGRTALVWTNNGATVSRLDAEPHSVLWGQADAISDNGQFVAGAGVPDSHLPPGEPTTQSNKFLYRWTEQGGVVALPGKINTNPSAWPPRHPNVGGISNNGKIIIGQDAFGGDRSAFIWTEAGGGQKLDDYLLGRGLNLADQFVTLTSATAITGDGRFVTGQWMDFGGSYGPYVLDLGIQQCGPADLGGQGGVAEPDGALDNNDFVVFIDKFFNHDAAADVGRQGGLPGSDGVFDNNDFVIFIDFFFDGCS